ncbi:hypothetical protein N9980_00500, partial [bacterium]|nr:hypothetical protein [bacterium]
MPSDLAKQFFAAKPTEIYFETLEIYHPNGIFRRFVRNQFLPKSFGLESTAPRNAGETVEFEAAAMEVKPVSQSSSTTVSLEVQMGRVGLQLKQEMQKIKDD